MFDASIIARDGRARHACINSNNRESLKQRFDRTAFVFTNVPPMRRGQRRTGHVLVWLVSVCVHGIDQENRVKERRPDWS